MNNLTKIRQGDEIIIISGKDKNKTGTIKKIFNYKKNNRVKVIVGGLNMYKKHIKPNPQINETGGIKEIEKPLDISNVMCYNSITKKRDKIGFRFLKDGKKERYFKSTEESIIRK